MKNKSFVSYLRVSTSGQGESGLGIEAQRAAVQSFIKSSRAELVREFVEIESGKSSDRPALAEAFRLCKDKGYVLLVAKLDRLSRNLHFITSLEESGIEFCCADNPNMNRLVLHIFASVAQHEREMISQRTKAALAAAKARGTRIGNPNPGPALQLANSARTEKAKARNSKLHQIVNEVKTKAGLSTLAEIARALNLRGIRTARGREWTPSHVHFLLKTA